MDNKKERKLDELLDSALAEYSNVEPRTGIEGRILANLATAQPGKRTRLRWWATTGLALAAAMVLVIFLTMPRETEPTSTIVAVLKPMSELPVMEVPELAHKGAKADGRTHPGSQPKAVPGRPSTTVSQLAVVKQDVFPAPSPLSDQEKLLLAYVRRTPREEIAANAKSDDEPALKNQINQVLPLQKNGDSNTNSR